MNNTTFFSAFFLLLVVGSRDGHLLPATAAVAVQGGGHILTNPTVKKMVVQPQGEPCRADFEPFELFPLHLTFVKFVLLQVVAAVLSFGSHRSIAAEYAVEITAVDTPNIWLHFSEISRRLPCLQLLLNPSLSLSVRKWIVPLQ